jgi:hypothetical protein
MVSYWDCTEITVFALIKKMMKKHEETNGGWMDFTILIKYSLPEERIQCSPIYFIDPEAVFWKKKVL